MTKHAASERTATARTAPRADRATGPEHVVGDAPTERAVRESRRVMIAWGVAAAVIAALFAVLVGIRIATMAAQIDFGPVFSVGLGVFVGVIVVALLAGLTALNARGNQLGEDLRVYGSLAAQTEREREDLRGRARSELEEAARCALEARRNHTLADEAMEQELAVEEQAVRLAATALGTLPPEMPSTDDIVRREFPVAKSTAKLLKKVSARGAKVVATLARRPATPDSVGEDPFAGRHLARPGSLSPADVSLVNPSYVVARPRRQRLPWILAGVGALLLVAGLLVAGLLVAPHAVADSLGGSPEGAARPEAGAAHSEAAAGTREGRDYSFMQVAHGEPVSWPCGAIVPVALAAGAPAGARARLEAAAHELTGASGLRLVVSPTPASADPAVTAAPGSVLVRYVSTSAFARRSGGSADSVGVTATRFAGGKIDDATVSIDRSHAGPGSAIGSEVLLHELGHALGLGHSTNPDEVMAPVASPSNHGVLQPGDLAGLRSLGCARS